MIWPRSRRPPAVSRWCAPGGSAAAPPCGSTRRTRQTFWLTPIASDGIGILCRSVIVIQRHALAVPHDLVGVSMTLVKVSIGQHSPVFASETVYAKTIERVTDHG